MFEPVMELHVVYDHPRDYPESFVVRRQRVYSNGVIIRDNLAVCFLTLEKAREHCKALGLYCIRRHPNDDPVIVEAWI
jgi:hypothetical protein